MDNHGTEPYFFHGPKKLMTTTTISEPQLFSTFSLPEGWSLTKPRLAGKDGLRFYICANKASAGQAGTAEPDNFSVFLAALSGDERAAALESSMTQADARYYTALAKNNNNCFVGSVTVQPLSMGIAPQQLLHMQAQSFDGAVKRLPNAPEFAMKQMEMQLAATDNDNNGSSFFCCMFEAEATIKTDAKAPDTFVLRSHVGAVGQVALSVSCLLRSHVSGAAVPSYVATRTLFQSTVVESFKPDVAALDAASGRAIAAKLGEPMAPFGDTPFQVHDVPFERLGVAYRVRVPSTFRVMKPAGAEQRAAETQKLIQMAAQKMQEEVNGGAALTREQQFDLEERLRTDKLVAETTVIAVHSPSGETAVICSCFNDDLSQQIPDGVPKHVVPLMRQPTQAPGTSGIVQNIPVPDGKGGRRAVVRQLFRGAVDGLVLISAPAPAEQTATPPLVWQRIVQSVEELPSLEAMRYTRAPLLAVPRQRLAVDLAGTEGAGLEMWKGQKLLMDGSCAGPSDVSLRTLSPADEQQAKQQGGRLDPSALPALTFASYTHEQLVQKEDGGAEDASAASLESLAEFVKATTTTLRPEFSAPQVSDINGKKWLFCRAANGYFFCCKELVPGRVVVVTRTNNNNYNGTQQQQQQPQGDQEEKETVRSILGRAEGFSTVQQLLSLDGARATAASLVPIPHHSTIEQEQQINGSKPKNAAHLLEIALDYETFTGGLRNTRAAADDVVPMIFPTEETQETGSVAANPPTELRLAAYDLEPENPRVLLALARSIARHNGGKLDCVKQHKDFASLLRSPLLLTAKAVRLLLVESGQRVQPGEGDPAELHEAAWTQLAAALAPLGRSTVPHDFNRHTDPGCVASIGGILPGAEEEEVTRAGAVKRALQVSSSSKKKKNAEAWMMAGIVALAEGDDDTFMTAEGESIDAQECFERALRCRGGCMLAGIWYGLGLLLPNERTPLRCSAASSAPVHVDDCYCFQQALALEPRDPNCAFNVGSCLKPKCMVRCLSKLGPVPRDAALFFVRAILNSDPIDAASAGDSWISLSTVFYRPGGGGSRVIKVPLQEGRPAMGEIGLLFESPAEQQLLLGREREATGIPYQPDAPVESITAKVALVHALQCKIGLKERCQAFYNLALLLDAGEKIFITPEGGKGSAPRHELDDLDLMAAAVTADSSFYEGWRYLRKGLRRRKLAAMREAGAASDEESKVAEPRITVGDTPMTEKDVIAALAELDGLQKQ